MTLKFLSKEGEYYFVKGRMIKRFGISHPPYQFIDDKKVKIPSSSKNYRIAWRDISRSNQKRRIPAAIIPQKWVAGNSLHVAYFMDQNIDRLKTLLIILNSIVFEFQIRSQLGTGHISLGVVREAYIPNVQCAQLVKKLSKIYDKRLINENAFVEAEVAATLAYGITKMEFGKILQFFKKFLFRN